MNKRNLIIVILFIINTLNAQKPCEFSDNFTDSIGSYKKTKETLVYERVFGNNHEQIFFSLLNDQNTLLLNINTIKKDTEFLKAECYDTRSKVFIQLTNKKIIPLFYANDESCSNLLDVGDNKVYLRLHVGYFLFPKEVYKELKDHPIEFIRIRNSQATKDFYVKDLLVSEISKSSSRPTNFFTDFLHCIDN